MTVVIAMLLLAAALYVFRDVAWIEEAPVTEAAAMVEEDREPSDPAPGQAAAWTFGLMPLSGGLR